MSVDSKVFTWQFSELKPDKGFFRPRKNLYFFGNIGSVPAIVAGSLYLQRWLFVILNIRCQYKFSSTVWSSVETYFGGSIPPCLETNKQAFKNPTALKRLRTFEDFQVYTDLIVSWSLLFLQYTSSQPGTCWRDFLFSQGTDRYQIQAQRN